MRVLILVGGLGTRLRPLTHTVPKPLLPIAGVPLMTRTLQRLRRQGVRDVVLAVQYLADQFRALYGDGAPFDLNLRIVAEPEPLGTAGAVRYALSRNGRLPDGPTLVLNGDELSSLDVVALWQFHHDHPAVATIATRHVADPSAYGVVVTDAHGYVQTFQEKPAAGTQLAQTINSGAYMLEPSVIERIPANTFAMLERDVFPALLAQQQPVVAFQHTAYSQDIGTLDGYLAANAAVLLGDIPHEQPSGQELTAGVWADDDVTIDRSATIVAPAMLGRGTLVEARARLERAIIGERVRIGASTTVVDSVVAAQTHVPAGSQITQQIIDSHTLGAE